MPFVTIDGLSTHYEVIGSGPPLLMYSPGGFDARMEKWSNLGVYKRIKLLEHLPKSFTCILFDRRETGLSGGRVERVTWDHYVAQGKGILDNLGFKKAHIMGGCMGCSPVARFGVLYPKTVMSMLLYWPVGGAKYRINAYQRFAAHLGFVQENGLDKVVELVKSHDKHFGQDPRCGPWTAPIRNDANFAKTYVELDLESYRQILIGMMRTLFDRDTSPGAEPEDLLQLDIPTLIVPGADASHATSAARYMQECLPNSEYWDISPENQNEANAHEKVLTFLKSIGS